MRRPWLLSLEDPDIAVMPGIRAGVFHRRIETLSRRKKKCGKRFFY
jgi:hypothetical protein